MTIEAFSQRKIYEKLEERLIFRYFLANLCKCGANNLKFSEKLVLIEF